MRQRGWDYIQAILDNHLDPKWGSPYWIERSQKLGIKSDNIHCVEDLSLFGPMDEDALRERMVEDFVPRSLLGKRPFLLRAETGGTLGKPKRTVYTEEEFQEAFIAPYCRVALSMGMERGLTWLYVGPGAPHIIGVAAREYARHLGCGDPCSVTVDARWFRKFPSNSHGFRSYMAHIVSQARDIVIRETISAIFTTPALLSALSETMTSKQREKIRAIHVGGMRIDLRFLSRAQKDIFPNAVVLPGYGNSLFGVAPAHRITESAIDYFPEGDRLSFVLVNSDSQIPPERRITMPVAEGEEGQLMCHRFDKSFMILNALERDRGTFVSPPRLIGLMRRRGTGIRNPAPCDEYAVAASAGVY